MAAAAIVLATGCARSLNVGTLTWATPVPSVNAPEFGAFALAQLDSIRAHDPLFDADVAVAQGDYSVLGVPGYSLRVPGVSNWEAYGRRYGVRRIAGPGEIIGGDAHRQLIDAALEYAERYNATILRRLPEPWH